MPMQHELRHTHFIYCLQKQPNGSYVFLNRNYKPIGFIDSGFVDYGQYPIGVHLAGLTPAKAAEISYAADTSTANIFLYNDGCTPTSSADNMQAYLQRLAVLAALKIDQSKHRG